LILKKIKSEIGIKSIDSKCEQDKVRKYILEKDNYMKQLFQNGTEDNKKEIKEIYEDFFQKK
jgi:hypothetical protein